MVGVESTKACSAQRSDQRRVLVGEVGIDVDAHSVDQLAPELEDVAE